MALHNLAHGSHFATASMDPSRLGGFVDPLLGLDHFHMSAPTFAPHPHAGFAAVAYVFEDSPGALRNRDSLGNDFAIEAGELSWTDSGTGVVHEERPLQTGQRVHGLQLFINLTAKSKSIPPRVSRLRSADVPIVVNGGSRVRVLAGSHAGITSPLAQTEPFHLLDVSLHDTVTLELRPSWHGILCCISGAIICGDIRVQAGELLGVTAPTPTPLTLQATSAARFVYLAGPASGEPIVSEGPFIMNSAEQIAAARQRYLRGAMGILPPLP